MKYLLILLLWLPGRLHAQVTSGEDVSLSGQTTKMHTVLDNLYQEMMPLCKDMVQVAQLIGCLGALFYIGYRVWKHIANAEPVDVFPLLRPFALAIAIAVFPGVLSLINGICSPITSVTAAMVSTAHQDVDRLLRQRELAAQGKDVEIPAGADTAGGYREYEDGQHSGFWSNLFSLNFNQLFKMFIAAVLETLYYAASICIDCLRTFHLVILAILGPLVFALSIYDGFQHTLAIWIARYINTYLWLPIANIFGALIAKVQAGMLRSDIQSLQQDHASFFSQTDAAYLIFLIIGIVGYFSIPSIANYVVHASSGSAIMTKVNNTLASYTRISKWMSAGSMGGSGGGGSMSHNYPGDDRKTGSMADAANSEDPMSGKIAGK